METLGHRIRRLRKSRHLGVREVARRAGIAQSTWYDIENDRQKSSTRLHHIADALGVTVVELETGARRRGFEPAQLGVLQGNYKHLRDSIEQYSTEAPLSVEDLTFYQSAVLPNVDRLPPAVRRDLARLIETLAEHFQPADTKKKQTKGAA
jgi:transcriptional regulator with XRE-family HTH domain